MMPSYYVKLIKKIIIQLTCMQWENCIYSFQQNVNILKRFFVYRVVTVIYKQLLDETSYYSSPLQNYENIQKTWQQLVFT